MNKKTEYRKLLTSLNKTQKDLAKELGLTEASVSRWKDNPPSYAISYLNACSINQNYAKSLTEVGNSFKLSATIAGNQTVAEVYNDIGSHLVNLVDQVSSNTNEVNNEKD